MKLIVALVAVAAFLGATSSGKVISGPAQLRSGYDDDSAESDSDIIACIAKILRSIKWSSDDNNNNNDDDENFTDFYLDDVAATSIDVSPVPETSSISQSRSAHKSVNRAANHNKGSKVHGQGKAHGSAHDKAHGKAHAKGKAHGNSHAKAHAKSHESGNHNQESKIDKNHQ